MKNDTQNTANTPENMQGSMRPFMFESLPIRGRLLRMPNITDQVGSLKQAKILLPNFWPRCLPPQLCLLLT